MRRHSVERRKDELILTSLVDIALCLVLGFLVAMPLFFETGIFVSAPGVARASVGEQGTDVKANIFLTDDGRILLNESEVSIAQLSDLLPKLLANLYQHGFTARGHLAPGILFHARAVPASFQHSLLVLRKAALQIPTGGFRQGRSFPASLPPPVEEVFHGAEEDQVEQQGVNQDHPDEDRDVPGVRDKLFQHPANSPHTPALRAAKGP